FFLFIADRLIRLFQSPQQVGCRLFVLPHIDLGLRRLAPRIGRGQRRHAIPDLFLLGLKRLLARQRDIALLLETRKNGAIALPSLGGSGCFSLALFFLELLSLFLLRGQRRRDFPPHDAVAIHLAHRV